MFLPCCLVALITESPITELIGRFYSNRSHLKIVNYSEQKSWKPTHKLIR